MVDEPVVGDPLAPAETTDPCVVGWALNERHAAVVYLPPERLSTSKATGHAKSAAQCPAIRNMESRYFVVRSPFDLDVGFTRVDDDQPALVNRRGDRSPIRTSALQSIVRLTAEAEWRQPDRPVLQVVLPYVFVADVVQLLVYCCL